MARINIEDCWWTDPRRSLLIKLVGGEEFADGLIIKAWRLAQQYWGQDRCLIPLKIWETIEANSKLIEAKLAEINQDGVYVFGSKERLEWIAERRDAARIGGKKSAETRRRNGTLQPKNGKNLEANSKQTQPSGSSSNSYSGSISYSNSGSSSDSGITSSSNLPKKANAFIVRYCENFKFKYGSNPEIQGKESGIAKRVTKNLSEEKIYLYLDAYFQIPDAYVIKAKHPVYLFEAKLNEITVFANSGNFTTLKQAQQADDSASNMLLLEKIRRGEV